MSEAVHVLIGGRVQGVWYRASARERALQLGLVGWVRNLPDGRVEGRAEGPRAALDAWVAWCREGPPAARVQAVEVTFEAARGALSDFEVRRR